ncbi:hypothetical protein PCH_Pc22g25280 [Penicillium rubens Wisconsin 54-1255]|uniref:Uncharacterized protein n=1 Tax=Penicillium rubens (strain ATCC 28089 / DSM 1075 / NRRL 1951 / Wisconsin 54-1255) TaxID=500485 RepID=B6HS48_PENRW|nr:hypothetical protein PCH_Pc22g25280 [Penicillium rubens Wisconsin 54-1255]
MAFDTSRAFIAACGQTKFTQPSPVGTIQGTAKFTSDIQGAPDTLGSFLTHLTLALSASDPRSQDSTLWPWGGGLRNNEKNVKTEVYRRYWATVIEQERGVEKDE